MQHEHIRVNRKSKKRVNTDVTSVTPKGIFPT